MKSTIATTLLATAAARTFCEHIEQKHTLPKHCTCSDDTEGFTFGCSADVLGKDTLELALQVNPCEEPVTATLKINDTRFGLHHELAGLTANDKAIHVPFPGLSFKLGHIANAGVMIDFDLTTPADSGDKHLDINLGFDVCGSIKILGHHKTICGSKIDKHLPIEVLDKSYDFNGMCNNTQTKTMFGENGKGQQKLDAVPTIPPVWTADIVATSNGTLPGVPVGTKSYTEYHDYTNKKRRLDFKEQYYTKIYRYDKKIQPPFNPGKYDPEFAAPKGYKMHLDSTGNPNPNSCCWLWLFDTDTGDNDKMFNAQVPPKSKDVGSTEVNGVTAEEWLFAGTFPFPQTDRYYFDNESNLVQHNSYASVFGKGVIIGNTTYNNLKVGPISNETFAVPTSKPTFGKCKQCGVDSMCPMEDCMS